LQDNAPKQEYSRSDVRRMLGVTEYQLRAWERLDLVRGAESFCFKDLIALRALLKLRESRISTQTIGRAVASLKHVDGVDYPLSELKFTPDGRRLAVQVAGQRLEPTSGQILFDFETAEPAGIRSFPLEQPAPNKANAEREAEYWFQRGLELEEQVAPTSETIEAYQNAVTLNPQAAGAWVNLGTIHYRMKRYRDAEHFYTRAVEADPTYPLAHFNLGNLHDEEGRLDKAEEFYKSALKLNPQYADAHFNLALLSERRGDSLRAVHHWKTYLKLDPASSWAAVARRQLDKLRDATLIRSQQNP
jgi:tetratricopeptide (TPR) repeat protein